MNKFFKKLRTSLRLTSLILLMIVTLLIATRLALPSFLIWHVNHILARIPDYTGTIKDIDVSLIRGAYVIKELKLLKTNGQVPTPFFAVNEADLSVEWKAFFNGKVVGELNLAGAELNFVQGPSQANSQTSISDEWLRVVKDLFPLRINRFEAENSSIHFRNLHSDPKVNVVLSNLHLIGTNLSNSRTPSKGLNAKINGSGFIEGKAPVKIQSTLDPSAATPRFEAELSMTKLPLTALNDYLRAYGNFDVEGGTIELYAAASARDGTLKGQIKPLAYDIKIFKSKTDNDSMMGFIWEALVAVASEIFENQRHQQLATVIEFEGKFDDPETSYWEIFFETVRNAFVKALKPGIRRESLASEAPAS